MLNYITKVWGPFRYPPILNHTIVYTTRAARNPAASNEPPTFRPAALLTLGAVVEAVALAELVLDADVVRVVDAAFVDLLALLAAEDDALPVVDAALELALELADEAEVVAAVADDDSAEEEPVVDADADADADALPVLDATVLVESMTKYGE